MNLEIERKYLLAAIPKDLIESGALQRSGRLRIEQTYLAFSGPEEVRVRKLTDEDNGAVSYTHTFKRGTGLAREEVEYTISEDIYLQLLENSGRSPLLKTRTKVTDSTGRLYEIDDYHQFGLLTVEVEFNSEAEALAFTAPSWIGEEVGKEREYRNKELWASVQKPRQ